MSVGMGSSRYLVYLAGQADRTVERAERGGEDGRARSAVVPILTHSERPTVPVLVTYLETDPLRVLAARNRTSDPAASLLNYNIMIPESGGE
ncbi:hypothetical protein DTO164E3_2119 [Paecilomyces variotii]|nr:hypothetical protein DTO164E3_2119 [Paecilomyces variotii]KAJ9208978.1 hypothetical protein DTO032I3_195 [Paecilomyces variotii]KAJ9282858.1 hypothetical protein DTO021D3_195 [Paecilomyces variotii]KAJ9344089.1 hypothetical protein DTO027B6_3525 [Paecilomyces variotii]KAJ9381718.1 hypothetical protein DTO032I4_5929 [Paecilomyces variotii]